MLVVTRVIRILVITNILDKCRVVVVESTRLFLSNENSILAFLLVLAMAKFMHIRATDINRKCM